MSTSDLTSSTIAAVDAVVSLCRLGAAEWLAPGVAARDHVMVWLVDRDRGDNTHLEYVIDDAAHAVAELRAEGRTVLLHCVAAQSRTPTVAARYSVIRFGMTPGRALADVVAVLPAAAPNPVLGLALEALAQRQS